jgi:hypothetical protein
MASALAVAIERKQWDLVAVVLLLAFAEVAARFPRETLEELLELLEADDD